MEKAVDDTCTKFHWIKRILFPFWICRILLLVTMGVAQVASVYWISQELDIKGPVLASLVVVELFSVLCISLDAIALILLARNALRPSVALIFQGIETLLWTGVAGSQVAAAVDASSKSRSFLPWMISAILYASFITMLMYAFVLYVRRRRHVQRKLGAYPNAERRYGSNHSLHDRAPSSDDQFNNTQAVSAHARHVSVASLESIYPPPPPYEPSRVSTPTSPSSFVIVCTPPDEPAGLLNPDQVARSSNSPA